MKTFPAFLIISIALSACTSQKSEIPVVDLQNPNKTKVVKLSEMLKSASLVRLETSKDILIGEGTKYLVGEKYIITAGEEKILLFSNTGSYIRTIAVTGNGPNEYANIVAAALDEKNNTLYINQRDEPGNILAYSLTEDKPIKKIPTGLRNLLYYIVVINDTVLAISPGMNTECNFLYLSTSGKIISLIKAPEGIGNGICITKLPDHFYYKPKQNDTLYIMENYKKIPFCYLNIENRISLTNHESGNLVSISIAGSDFLIAQKIHASFNLRPGDILSTNKTDKITFYWIDSKKFSASEIVGFYNDFFGINEPFMEVRFRFRANDESGFLRYSAFELKKLFKTTLQSINLSDSVKQKISLLDGEINENDNPVLIIGKVK